MRVLKLEAGGEPTTEYQPPRPVDEDPPLVGEDDLPALWAISHVIEGRRELQPRLAAIEAQIAEMEENRHGP